jgi:hypothetical protein
MLLILWRVVAAEFVGETITQTARAFLQKYPTSVKKLLTKEARRGRGFFS